MKTIRVRVPERHPVAPPAIETKFLHLRQAVPLGHRIDGWRVCWLGGWDRGHVFFVVMVEAPSAESGCPVR